MQTEILAIHERLQNHRLYGAIRGQRELKIFMQYHVFAVWDFMSLLKSLQRTITCVNVPWFESVYDPELVRLINEIVLGEESDRTVDGKAISHFSLYLAAMKEIDADTTLIESFLKTRDYSLMPKELATVIDYHLQMAQSGKLHEVAACFFYGREKLIPAMFSSFVSELKLQKIHCPSLMYYLERHIEVDGQEHGPLALKCLNLLTDNSQKRSEAEAAAIKSLEMRESLWNFIYQELKKY